MQRTAQRAEKHATGFTRGKTCIRRHAQENMLQVISPGNKQGAQSVMISAENMQPSPSALETSRKEQRKKEEACTSNEILSKKETLPSTLQHFRRQSRNRLHRCHHVFSRGKLWHKPPNQSAFQHGRFHRPLYKKRKHR